MRPAYDIVVSAENNHYTAWQAMLLHYSAVSTIGRAPIVVVHGTGELVSGYEKLAQRGGRIQRAPNYRSFRGLDYAPRNTAATLATVETDAGHIVLCDPDMLFLSDPAIEHYCSSDDRVTLDYVPYLSLNEQNRKTLEFISRRTNVPLSIFELPSYGGGVPHIIPSARRKELSETWLTCIDDLAALQSSSECPWDELPWFAVMWALVAAIHQLRLPHFLTTFCTLVHDGSNHLCPSPKPIIHYCCESRAFDKRCYTREIDAVNRVWARGQSESSTGPEIFEHLHSAAQYYGLLAGR